MWDLETVINNYLYLISTVFWTPSKVECYELQIKMQESPSYKWKLTRRTGKLQGRADWYLQGVHCDSLALPVCVLSSLT